MNSLYMQDSLCNSKLCIFKPTPFPFEFTSYKIRKPLCFRIKEFMLALYNLFVEDLFLDVIII